MRRGLKEAQEESGYAEVFAIRSLQMSQGYDACRKKSRSGLPWLWPSGGFFEIFIPRGITKLTPVDFVCQKAWGL